MQKLQELISQYRSQLTWSVGLLFACLFLLHWYYVGHYAVNAPLADEWPVMFSTNRPIKPFTWQWVLEFNNEHRTVPTKLQVWANYLLFDLNLRYQVIFNFALYGLTILGTLKVLRFSGLSYLFSLSFLIFALCDADKNNFHWAIQSQWHCFFFGFIWGIYFLFREDQSSVKSLILSFAFFVLASWSFASGLILSIVGIGVYLVHNLIKSLRKLPATPWSRVLGVLIAPFIINTFLWASDYVSPENHPHYVWPWQSRFWSFLSAELSWIYGIEARSDLWSTLALASAIVALSKLTLMYWKKPSKNMAMLLAFSLGMLACLCSISMGRGGLGTPAAKESRYYAIAILLLPTIAWGLYQLKGYGRHLVLITFLLCSYGHADNWNFKKTYRTIAIRMINGINCIERDPRQKSCEYPIFGGELDLTWPWAKKLGLSFATQDFPLPIPD